MPVPKGKTLFRRLQIIAIFLALALLVSGAVFAADTETTPPAQKPASAHHVSHKSKKSRNTASRKRGQQKIDSARAQQIQEALIRQHYLSGKPSGTWDAATQAAMQKYQADNGWQSKTTPDSRALIKLGLGPDQQHLLNPESAMTSAAPAAGTVTPPVQASGVANPPKPQN